MLEIKHFYEFAEFRLDLKNKSLTRHNSPVQITRKMFETLLVLVENADRLVEKDELMRKIWHDRFVEETNLTFNIKMLRKALGDRAGEPRFIETVPRRGYRFIAEVREVFEEKKIPPIVVSPAPEKPILRHSYRFGAILAILLTSSIVLAWIWKINPSEAHAPVLNAQFEAAKISETGRVQNAVISPSGELIAYSNQVNGLQSLWLRDLETSNNIQIVPPSEEKYYGLAFSNDGATLFFTRKNGAVSEQPSIYRIPVFGGVPVKIADEAQGWISLSPDDKTLLFVRYEPGVKDFNKLMMVETDGRGEREIKTSERQRVFWSSALAPDGRTVASAYGHSMNGGQEMGLVETDVETGAMTEMTAEKFFHVKDLKWLPNKSGLLFTAKKKINEKCRIWKLDYRQRTVAALTSDAIDYDNLSLTARADRVVATTYAADFHLYLKDAANPKNFNAVTQARDKFGFAPDNRIVYASDTAGNEDIWVIDADGTNQRQLTTDRNLDFSPLVAPDTRFIYFTSNRSGESQIWRMDADGSNQTQITRRAGGYPRFVTKDGGWLYFQDFVSEKLTKISTDGGAERVYDEDYGFLQAFSPDGSKLAFLIRNPQTGLVEIRVAMLETGKVIKTFAPAAQTKSTSFLLCWRDESTLVYSLDEPIAEDTLWEQNLDRPKPEPAGELGRERIVDLQYSPDGRNLALIRGTWQHDAYLIRGFK
ncbi:MAG: PD40 domain-containing protein [Acidobacteria bacterium]|nr:PD40 domain-containing protein [Acidobacteriota bacterium]